MGRRGSAVAETPQPLNVVGRQRGLFDGRRRRGLRSTEPVKKRFAVAASAVLLLSPAAASGSTPVASSESRPGVNGHDAVPGAGSAKNYDQPLAPCWKAKYRQHRGGEVTKTNTGSLKKRVRWRSCMWLEVPKASHIPTCGAYPRGECPQFLVDRWLYWSHSGAAARGWMPSPKQAGTMWTRLVEVRFRNPSKWYSSRGRMWVFNQTDVRTIRVVPVAG